MRYANLDTPSDTAFGDRTEGGAGRSDALIQRAGGLASFLLAAAFFIPSVVDLFGNLRNAGGAFAYDLADFIYGPVWAASLVTMVFALRERIGERAPRRIAMALMAAGLAGGMMVAVACIRSANRHYHIHHPELNLEDSTEVLVVWTTVLAGVTGAGWHFLGWAFFLIAASGWASRIFPRLLTVLLLAAGAVSLFVYALPAMEGIAVLLSMAVSIWQGTLFWRGSA